MEQMVEGGDRSLMGEHSSAAELAHALGHGEERPNGRGGFLVFCPVHEIGGGHKTPSLDIDQKNGKALWVCRTNGVASGGDCTQRRITDALRDLGILPKKAARNGSSPHAARLLKAYDYRDEEGRLLYQVCRWEPKKFTQRHPCPNCEDGSCGDKYCKKGWIWNLHGVRRVLYHLPEVIASATPNAAGVVKGILVVEGERDADNLIEKCGSIATTNSEGAEKWHREFNQFFRGRRVVILPDNDQKGERHALIVARNLRDTATDIRIVRLPGLAEKQDVTDWLAAGGTREQLLALIEATPTWQDGDSSPAFTVRAGTAVDATMLAPAWSEDHIALQFVKEHGASFRYVASWGLWMRWNQTKWERDETHYATNAVRELCRKVASDAFLDPDGEAGPKVAKSLASARTVSAVEKLASIDRAVAASSDQWDRDPWCLNTTEGCFDLQRDQMNPHSAEKYLTKVTAVAPAQYADCPRWLAFLDRIMSGDDETIQFLKRMAGYFLTGSTREQALFFAYGSGANGKGVFMNTIRRILHDYATSTAMETLTISRGDRHPTEVADLNGARLVITSETGEGRWNEARIKQFTGGDPLKARFMNKDFFEFYPTFKLLISGNRKPRLRNVDRAMRRRLLMVPFNVIIPDIEQDKEMVEHLQAEWCAILRWALDGCLEWQRDGLNPPAKVRGATEDYFDSEDSIGSWIADCCIKESWAPTSELYSSWKTWAEKSGEFVGTLKAFSQALEIHGYERSRVPGSGHSRFTGISLRAE